MGNPYLGVLQPGLNLPLPSPTTSLYDRLCSFARLASLHFRCEKAGWEVFLSDVVVEWRSTLKMEDLRHYAIWVVMWCPSVDPTS